MFLLDTNIISEMRKKKLGTVNSGVIQFFTNTLQEQAFISVISIMEIKQGILHLQHRNDNQQAHILQEWLDNDILTAFEGRILPVTTDVALQCASFHVLDKSSANDALIGATAKVSNLTVVTRNDKDFNFKGVKVVNPFVDIGKI